MYRNASPQAYRESAVMTASPTQLVVMLYDGAGRFLRQTIALQEQGETVAAHAPLGRAVAIIEELLATIDVERGGDIAGQLQGIYVFILSELADQRLNADPAKITPLVTLLAELRESWAQIAAQEPPRAPAATVSQTAA